MSNRVKLNNTNSNESVLGTIIGIGHVTKDDQAHAVYLVELDHGFHDEARDNYFNVVTVPLGAEYLEPIT